MDSSKTQGSMTGQEERDMLFARLFGITSIVQSGLLTRISPLPSSSTPASSLEGYTEVLSVLVALGEKKSWLREVAWWTFGLAVDALSISDVPWKDNAARTTQEMLYDRSVTWTPEKLGLTLKLKTSYPDWNWKTLLQPTFKNLDILSIPNFGKLSKILKVRFPFSMFRILAGLTCIHLLLGVI
jgi:DNA polymerase phi